MAAETLRGPRALTTPTSPFQFAAVEGRTVMADANSTRSVDPAQSPITPDDLAGVYAALWCRKPERMALQPARVYRHLLILAFERLHEAQREIARQDERVLGLIAEIRTLRGARS